MFINTEELFTAYAVFPSSAGWNISKSHTGGFAKTSVVETVRDPYSLVSWVFTWVDPTEWSTSASPWRVFSVRCDKGKCFTAWYLRSLAQERCNLFPHGTLATCPGALRRQSRSPAWSRGGRWGWEGRGPGGTGSRQDDRGSQRPSSDIHFLWRGDLARLPSIQSEAITHQAVYNKYSKTWYTNTQRNAEGS